MRFGAHGQVWAGAFDKAGVELTVLSASEIGFDLIEFPLMDVENFAKDHARKLLDEHGMGCSGSLGLTVDSDITSPNKAAVQAGRDYLMSAVDLLADLGGTELCGVLESAMTKYAEPATPQGRESSQEVLREVAAHAASAGINVSLEVVNRYESNLFNTGRDCLRFIEEGDLNVGVHLDSYHMNIEEIDMWSPILDCRDRLGYVHIGESNRGYLGAGNVDFGTMFDALRYIKYDGCIVFESFSSAVVSAELSNTLAVWRNLWSDSQHLAAHALAYMKGGMAGLHATEAALAAEG